MAQHQHQMKFYKKVARKATFFIITIGSNFFPWFSKPTNSHDSYFRHLPVFRSFESYLI